MVATTKKTLQKKETPEEVVIDPAVTADTNTASDNAENTVVIDPVKEEPEKEPEVTVTHEESAPMVERNVKAKFKQDYHCVVGGEYYSFEKGKTYTIPINVKRIVSRANGVLDPM